MKKNKKLDLPLFNLIVMILSFGLAILGIISIFIVKSEAAKSRMIFSSFQCLMMALIILVPAVFFKKIKLDIPRVVQVIYVVFGFCAIILGDVANFYDLLPWWDSLLHAFSGILLGGLGFILINTMNNDEKLNFKLSPLFVCCVAFCFVMAVGSIWEILEYTMDHWFGLNSQQFMETTGGTVVSDSDIPLVGHAALRDTMKDLILDFAGGLAMSIIGYLNIKHKKKDSIVSMKFQINKTEEQD